MCIFILVPKLVHVTAAYVSIRLHITFNSALCVTVGLELLKHSQPEDPEYARRKVTADLYDIHLYIYDTC